ncbi:hypothetical protein GCM10017784_21610 [Deinococcus indicus]|jgi:hypothetical protein|uniref:hypothetical protein n=1 Tax=Deinococcus indicus TaxID=223556 RepID=UPI00174EA40C|nr:hypothetical protein [Deinococcus indicus]GHG28549.1 hypothetical protein GCM10017784_21610 [Deinococcus indicus]
MTRKMTVQKYRLGEEPREREYWLTRTPEERFMEVFRLRAMWGAAQTPMVRAVTSVHRLGEKGKKGP